VEIEIVVGECQWVMYLFLGSRVPMYLCFGAGVPMYLYLGFLCGLESLYVD
jgi:hypothetical protein